MNQLIKEFKDQQAQKQIKFHELEQMTTSEKKILLLRLIQKDDCVIDQCFMEDSNIALLIRL